MTGDDDVAARDDGDTATEDRPGAITIEYSLFIRLGLTAGWKPPPEGHDLMVAEARPVPDTRSVAYRGQQPYGMLPDLVVDGCP